jgi:hypothetical protein
MRHHVKTGGSIEHGQQQLPNCPADVVGVKDKDQVRNGRQ